MRVRQLNAIIQTDNEAFANLIWLGNRPDATAIKNHDTGVCQVGHARHLEIRAAWAEKAGVPWTNIEDIVIGGIIARLTPHKLIITEPSPRSGPPTGESK